jgi:hypothetical protein
MPEKRCTICKGYEFGVKALVAAHSLGRHVINDLVFKAAGRTFEGIGDHRDKTAHLSKPPHSTGHRAFSPD